MTAEGSKAGDSGFDGQVHSGGTVVGCGHPLRWVLLCHPLNREHPSELNDMSYRFLLVALCVSCPSQLLSAAETRTEPYHDQPHAIPGKIEAEHYDKGRAEHAYHDIDEKNHGVDYRGVTQVDIEKRADASNGHGIGWTRKGEWVVYSVTVKEAGSYDLEFPVASNKQGGTFHLEFDGKDVTGPIQVPDTGSWQKLQIIKKSGVRLKKGSFKMKMVMDKDGPSGSIGDIDYVRFRPAASS